MKSTYTAKKTILASSVFLGMAFGTAHAEQCFKLAPASDIIRISGLALTDGPKVGSTHRMFVGSWIATGAYVLPIVGSKAFNLGSTTIFRFGLHGTNVTGAFGGNMSCALDAIEGGAWSLACPAGPNPVGPGIAPFTNKGTPFTKVSCVGQPPSVTEKAAGAPHQ